MARMSEALIAVNHHCVVMRLAMRKAMPSVHRARLQQMRLVEMMRLAAFQSSQ